MKNKVILGIDFGGSGIKGAPVNIKTGKLLSKRFRIPTPSPSTPENVAKVIGEIATNFNWDGSVGVGFPSVVINGVVKTASNIDKSWIGVNASEFFSKAIHLPVSVVNDADAAGMAEINFGAGKNKKGTVVLLTIGTGIGSALFTKGHLVANSEIGQIYLNNGKIGEEYTAASVREKEDLDWTAWGVRLNIYLKEVENILRPELIIIGGGDSKRSEKFMHAIDIETKLVMAKQRNEAGIIGAALIARKRSKSFRKLIKLRSED
jgi:polyphosphate glucokinase